MPPSFFAAWSVKARGGYAEALALGRLCLLAAQRLADRRRPTGRRRRAGRALGGDPRSRGRAGALDPPDVGRDGGGGVAYVGSLVPLARASSRPGRIPPKRPGWPRSQALGAAAIGLVVGLSPAIVHNVASGFPSLRFAAEGGTEPRAALVNLWGLVRYGLPVLVGLAEGTPIARAAAPGLADPTWAVAGWSPSTLPLIGLGLVWWHRRALVALVRGRGTPAERGPALFLLVLLLVPPFVAVSRFANLWAEPRYALPIYAAVPLVASAIWAARARSRLLAGVLVAGLLGLNLFSLVTSDYRLSLPTSAGESTAANRAELIAALRGARHRSNLHRLLAGLSDGLREPRADRPVSLVGRVRAARHRTRTWCSSPPIRPSCSRATRPAIRSFRRAWPRSAAGPTWRRSGCIASTRRSSRWMPCAARDHLAPPRKGEAVGSGQRGARVECLADEGLGGRAAAQPLVGRRGASRSVGAPSPRAPRSGTKRHRPQHSALLEAVRRRADHAPAAARPASRPASPAGRRPPSWSSSAPVRPGRPPSR